MRKIITPKEMCTKDMNIRFIHTQITNEHEKI